MPVFSFPKRFVEFCERNHRRRALEVQGEVGSNSVVLDYWQEALDSLVECYRQDQERVLLRSVLANPYFPLSKLRKLNLEEFAKEAKFTNLSKENLARISAEVLLNWAGIFLRIGKYLAILNINGRVSSMKLTGSPLESLPESSYCDYCGGCCEIRGGPPEFTGGFEPPEQWIICFRGDACEYQRFCPFLFEYFATGKFFCSIYRVKPECCWTFDREECDFLQKDFIRERAVPSRTGFDGIDKSRHVSLIGRERWP